MFLTWIFFHNYKGTKLTLRKFHIRFHLRRIETLTTPGYGGLQWGAEGLLIFENRLILYNFVQNHGVRALPLHTPKYAGVHCQYPEIHSLFISTTSCTSPSSAVMQYTAGSKPITRSHCQILTWKILDHLDFDEFITYDKLCINK